MLITFAQTMSRQSELQTVALKGIFTQLAALLALSADPVPDAAKVHGILRDLVRAFKGLADNTQAFMAGMSRTIELRHADAQAVIAFKQRLIDYLQRFIGNLMTRSGAVAESASRSWKDVSNYCLRWPPNESDAIALPAEPIHRQSTSA